MNRKTSVFALIVLTIALILIPSAHAEYPIENMVIIQPLPDTMVAGSSHEMIITFDNVAQESVFFIIKITVTSDPPIGEGEIFIDKINLNGVDLIDLSIDVFTTVEGSVSFSSDNVLRIVIRTAINLMPGDYIFDIELWGEEMVEPGPPKPSPPRPVLNRPPVADAGPNQTVDIAQMVEFSGVDSTDPDGYLISWTWDFGDGTEASGVDVSHRYLMGGNYTVTLTVVDVRLGEDTDTCTITVKEHVIPTPPLPPFFSNLIITPEKLELGDNVTISVDIMNPNDRAISYGFEMEIGDLTLLVDVELEAYESKTVSRTTFPTAVGTYNVTVMGMTGNFTVEAPEIPLKSAEFEVTDIVISPEEVEPGDEVTISVLVTNIGEETGDYTVNLDCENVPAGPYLRVQETVSLEGGESERVEFEVSRDIEGIYAVTVDGLTGSFEVKAPPEPEPPKPAEFVFSNLEITPGEEISPDEELTITISVDATNDGEERGSYTVKIKLDGVVIASEEVTLEGGDSITASFDVTKEEGTYEVEVEGLTGTFTIDLAEEPPFWTSPGYVAGMVIVVTSAGAVIYYIWKAKLFSPISPDST